MSRRRNRSAEGPRASLKQLLPYLLEHRGTLIVVAVLSILSAAASLAQPLLVGQVIGQVQLGEALGALVWVLVALVIAGSLLKGYQHYLLQRTGTAVVLSSRNALIRRILHLPISQFDARRTGDLVSRVGTDTTLLYAVLTQGFADTVGNAVLFVGALIAMAIIDPVLLAIIVLVIGISATVVVALGGRIRRASSSLQETVGELASGTERAIGSIRTIRASGASERETAALEKLAQTAYQHGVSIAKVSALVVPVAGVALQVSLLTVLGFGGMRVASGAISVGSLVTFILFLFLLIMPLASAFGAITSVSQALGALGRIEEIVALPEEDYADAESKIDYAAVATQPDNTDTAMLEFAGVSFSYPDPVVAARRAAAESANLILHDAGVSAPAAEIAAESERGPVLQDVSFRVPQGARVALVGPSGAGKSTILALIERFYDPTSGSILLNGRDVREFSRTQLRAQFGYVEQDAPTLAGTIADNVRLASPEASDADCEQILRRVNLGSVIDRSALGIHTQVGESGVLLSGGERQRLAIARALLSEAPILLLDESTSSLDSVNENLMREAIDTAAANRTLLVIAHRLATVVGSDHIVVLDQGRVVGQGTHSELLSSTPLYRELARHQLLV